MDNKDEILVEEFKDQDFDEEIKKNDENQYKRMYKKGLASGIAITLTLTLAITAVASVFMRRNGYVVTTFKPDKKLTGKILSNEVETKVSELLGALSQYYYDDMKNSDLAEGMYAGLVNGVGDKYTTYFTKKKYEEYIGGTSGTYYGIGAVLNQNIDTGVISITRVYDNSPAKDAGLKAGDIFVSADGHKAEGVDLTEFVTHVKGDEGTKVKLVMVRSGKQLKVNVERRKVEIPTVEYQMLEDKTGYIQILEFDKITTSQFKKALKDLRNQGMTALIVDLRDNPGGMVNAVTEILDEILPKGLLVYTQDKNGEKTEYKSDKKELGLPLAVLVNGNSASASEIFAGAVKDYKYGTLIGTKTFGKGIVQVLAPLSDGSAIKVTTSKYFTPKGNYIHEVGIEPDEKLEYKYLGDEKEEYDITKDNQVQKALEILEERR